MILIQFVIFKFILFLYHFNIIETYDMEELTVDLKLLEMDLLDKCEEISNVKDLINFLINTNSDIDSINKTFTKFQELNTEIDELIQIGAKDIYNKYHFHRIDNNLKNQLDEIFRINSQNIIPESDKIIGKSFQLVLQKLQFLLEYKMKLLKILSKNRHKNILENSTSIFLKEFFNNIHDFDKKLSMTFYMFRKENNYYDTKFDYAFLNFEKRYEIWNQTNFLYYNLHDFVKKRIIQKYKLNYDLNYIPSYLLGLQLGDDWTNILDFVLPYPEFFNNTIFQNKVNEYELKNLLLSKNDLYSNIEINVLGNYDMCPIDLLHYCRSSLTQLRICSYLRPNDYFDLFEKFVETKLLNKNYTCNLLNDKLKIYVLHEAIKGISAVIAVEHLLNEFEFLSDVDKYNKDMIQKLILALRFLPKFAYYYFVDEWRFNFLTNNHTNYSNDFHQKWHYLRLQIEKIDDNDWNFLFDSNIYFNKPYIGKFFGLILQFQLMKIINEENNGMTFVENFRQYLNKIIRGEINDDYLINELNTKPLIDYFQPLWKFFEEAPDFPEITTMEITTIVSDEYFNEFLLNNSIEDQTKLQNNDNNINNLIFNISIGLLAFFFTFILCLLISLLLYFVSKKIFKKKKIIKNRRYS